MILPYSFAVIVTGAGEAIQDELEDTPESGGVPAKMRLCFLVPGNIVYDDCKCGQLALTILRIVPTDSYPIDASNSQVTSACGPQAEFAECLASISRCAPTLDNQGRAPSCDALETAALTLQGDRYAMDKALRCYLYGLKQERPQRIFDYRVGAAVFPGPEGACMSVEIPFSFLLR